MVLGGDIAIGYEIDKDQFVFSDDPAEPKKLQQRSTIATEMVSFSTQLSTPEKFMIRRDTARQR